MENKNVIIFWELNNITILILLCRGKKLFKEGVKFMKKNKSIYIKLLEKIAIKIATADANATCACISYQPRLPKSVKKLRRP